MSKNTLLSNLINYISANSSGNVVVAAPTSGLALDVNGTGRFTGALTGTSATFSSNTGIIVGANSRAFIRQTTGGDAEIGAPSGGTLSLFNNGSSALSFGATGAATFSSSVTATGVAYISGNSNTGPIPYLQLTDNYGSAGRNWAIMNGYEAYGTFSIKVSSAIGGNPTTGTPVFNITQGGNVGIGTTAPTTAGGAYIGLNISGATGASLVLTSGANLTYLYANNGTADFSIENAGAQIFRAGSAERMRITSGGVVLINQTTTSLANAGAKMQVATDMLTTGSLAGYFWENRSGGVTSNSNWYGWYTTSGTIYLFNGASNIASINTSSGAYTALSDVNKKKDFEDSSLGLNAILGLKPKLFRMKDQDESSSKQLGFIAQEVKDYIPQAYIQTKGEKEDFIGLDDRPIIATLVKAVQEQQAQIQELKQQLENK